MSTGQMVEDVRLAVEGRCEVSFYGRPGGVVATPEEIARVLSSAYHRMASLGGGGSRSRQAQGYTNLGSA